jgi:hypothetical protein
MHGKPITKTPSCDYTHSTNTPILVTSCVIALINPRNIDNRKPTDAIDFSDSLR